MFNFGIANVGPVENGPMQGTWVLVTLTNTDRVWFRITSLSDGWFVSLIMPKIGSYELADKYE